MAKRLTIFNYFTFQYFDFDEGYFKNMYCALN